MDNSRVTMQNVVLDITKLSTLEQEEYATRFAEGSQDLKDTLLYLWKSGITTYACCAGHEPERLRGRISPNKPYITFDISLLNSQELKNLLAQLIVLNESQDTPLLTFSISSQLFDRDLFMETVTEGNIDETVFERHSINIRFNDYQNETNFSQLLYILQNLKTQENIVHTQLKQLSEKELNFTSFVDMATQVNDISLQKYQSVCNVPLTSYQALQLSYRQGELSQNFAVKRPEDFEYFEVKDEVIEVAEGYYTPVFIEGGIKFFTIKNGELIEINQTEIKKLTPYIINPLLEFEGDFNKKKVANALKSIENEITKIQEV